MSYLLPIPAPRCQEACCGKTARVELMNNFNSRMGVYCRRHGERRLKKEQAGVAKGQP